MGGSNPRLVYQVRTLASRIFRLVSSERGFPKLGFLLPSLERRTFGSFPRFPRKAALCVSERGVPFLFFDIFNLLFALCFRPFHTLDSLARVSSDGDFPVLALDSASFWASDGWRRRNFLMVSGLWRNPNMLPAVGHTL